MHRLLKWLWMTGLVGACIGAIFAFAHNTHFTSWLIAVLCLAVLWVTTWLDEDAG